MSLYICQNCGSILPPGATSCTDPNCGKEEKPTVQLFTFNPYGNGLETGAYENLGLVSAYMALGTGPASKFLSSLTDFFGSESKAYNEKMTEATDACIWSLKTNAYKMGADAVIGVHTTFTELTAAHGQILVCMIGTAVKKNYDMELKELA